MSKGDRDFKCEKCGLVLLSFKGNKMTVMAGGPMGQLGMKRAAADQEKLAIHCPTCGTETIIPDDLLQRMDRMR